MNASSNKGLYYNKIIAVLLAGNGEGGGLGVPFAYSKEPSGGLFGQFARKKGYFKVHGILKHPSPFYYPEYIITSWCC